jgi:hypothetical protein
MLDQDLAQDDVETAQRQGDVLAHSRREDGSPQSNGPLAARGSAAPASVVDHGELIQRLEAVRVAFAKAAADLRRSAEVMESTGVPPTHRLVQMIGDCHRQFLRLRFDVTRRAEQAGLLVPPLDRISGLNDLATLVESLTSTKPAGHSREPVAPHVQSEGIRPLQTAPPEPANTDPESTATPLFAAGLPQVNAEMQPAAQRADVSEKPKLDEEREAAIRVKALDILDAVLRLSPKDGKELHSLTACKNEARAMREAIACGSAGGRAREAETLASGEHGFASLLIIVKGSEGLTDAEWAAHHTRISESFGRALAVAAARSRIATGGSQDPHRD